MTPTKRMYLGLSLVPNDTGCCDHLSHMVVGLGVTAAISWVSCLKCWPELGAWESPRIQATVPGVPLATPAQQTSSRGGGIRAASADGGTIPWPGSSRS